MTVSDLMTRDPITVTPATTVGELVELFARHDVNSFPVLDEHRFVCGIVAKLDVLRMLRPDQNLGGAGVVASAQARVGDIMRRGVVSVEPRDPVGAAADLMVETRLRSLPVVQRKSGGPLLVGIVSQGDLLRGLRNERAEAAPAVTGSQA